MKSTISLLAILILSFSVGSQTRRKSVKPKPKTATNAAESLPTPTPSIKELIADPTPPAPAFADSPFDRTNALWEFVPKDYLGIDFNKYFLAGIPLLKAKDEFETTEAYERRIREAEKKTLYGSINPSSVIAIRYDMVKSSPLSYEAVYDADKEILNLSIRVSRILALTDSEPKLETVNKINIRDSKISNVETYEAQNGFGAKTKVTKGEVSEYSLVIRNLREFRQFLAEYNTQLNFSLNLSAARAREAKTNLSYLFIVQPVKPFVGVSFDKTKPKFDNPLDVETTTQYIDGNLLELWIYNKSTGEIYQKIKNEPITAGKLKINSPVRSDAIVILNKSLVDILVESGAIPTETSNGSNRHNLLATFLKAAKNNNSKKYKLFLDTVTPLLKAHTVRQLTTTSWGSAEIEGLPFGTYYIFSGWQDYSGTSIWDLEVEVKNEEQSVSLSSSNATYK